MPAEPAADAGPAVEADGLSRRYGSLNALHRLDLRVPRGEFLTVFGPNGAGKSTLVKLLAGLARPSEGRVRIFGADLHGPGNEASRGRIGLLGHASFLYPGLSARENLTFYARMYRVTDPFGRSRELLAEMELSDRGDDPVSTYSRGMLQRLSIARVLVHDPDLVLLDEPYTGLDPHASERLSRLLRLVHGRGRTVVMTTHDLAVGWSLCSRFLILARGRAVLDSTPAEVPEGRLAQIYQQTVGGA